MKTIVGDCDSCSNKNIKVKVIENRKICLKCLKRARALILGSIYKDRIIKIRPLKGVEK